MSNVYAVDDEKTYNCEYIPDSGTIGQVYCCDMTPKGAYCTTCDNTKPPSNCGPREPYGEIKGKDISNPNIGGIYTPNDSGSSDKSNAVDEANVNTDGTFNSDDGSETLNDSRADIDPNEVNSGGVFNQ
jgi:hypothetical protein